MNNIDTTFESRTNLLALTAAAAVVVVADIVFVAETTSSGD